MEEVKVETQEVQEAPKLTVEQMVAVVLVSFKRGHDVDLNDDLTRRVTTKLIRRGMLTKSVVTGKITITDYGNKVLRMLGVNE